MPRHGFFKKNCPNCCFSNCVLASPGDPVKVRILTQQVSGAWESTFLISSQVLLVQWLHLSSEGLGWVIPKQASLEAWSSISLTAPPSCVLPSGFLTFLITRRLPLIFNAATQDENAMSCFVREKMSYASLLSKHLGKEIDWLFKMLLSRLEKRQRKTFLHRSKGRMVCLL